MQNDNLLNFDDLKDILGQLEGIKVEEEVIDEEVIASQRRYEQIIMKHKNDKLELWFIDDLFTNMNIKEK